MRLEPLNTIHMSVFLYSLICVINLGLKNRFFDTLTNIFARGRRDIYQFNVSKLICINILISILSYFDELFF